MADIHSIQSALNKAAIFANRQHEKNGRILSLLTGALALIDPDKNSAAVNLLEIAFDDAGDIENLIALENALQEAASV